MGLDGAPGKSSRSASRSVAPPRQRTHAAFEHTRIAGDSPEMNVILAYVYKERRGVPLEPGKH